MKFSLTLTLLYEFPFWCLVVFSSTVEEMLYGVFSVER